MKHIRRLTRIAAFKIIFQRLHLGIQNTTEEEILEKLKKQPKNYEFSLNLIDAAWKNKRFIEERINEYSRIKRSRSSSMQAILLISAAEFIYNTETPPKVIINEAIELCREYSNGNHAGYCNSVLDNFWKDFRDE